MAFYNKVILMGNLTRDPVLKYLPSGTPVANFGLAINRRYTDRESGEKREEVCFVDVDTFGAQAENCNQYLNKGKSVLVEGRLRYHTWETEDGQRRSKLSVTANNVQFMPRPAPQAQQQATSQESSETLPPPEPEVATKDDIPF